MSDECPVGCGRTRKAGHLMCPSCWSTVPKQLQDRVNRTWAKWRRNRGNAEALNAYREASDAAIASVP